MKAEFNSTSASTEDLKDATVEEKIHLEKHLPFNPKQKKNSTSDLYFHEIVCEPSFGQKFLKYLVSTFLSFLFVLLLPVVAIIMKITSRSALITKIKTTGKRGVIFTRYKFTTRNKNGEYLLFGKFLEKTGISKLPSIINVWRGEMNLVGPLPYSVTTCNYWNSKISDFYKRFSFKPGYFGVTSRISEKENLTMVKNNLAYELRYIIHTSVDQDLRHIIGSSD